MIELIVMKSGIHIVYVYLKLLSYPPRSIKNGGVANSLVLCFPDLFTLTPLISHTKAIAVTSNGSYMYA